MPFTLKQLTASKKSFDPSQCQVHERKEGRNGELYYRLNKI